MSQQVDLYNSTYGNFKKQVLAEVRCETYGEDIGQNSWITTERRLSRFVFVAEK